MFYYHDVEEGTIGMAYYIDVPTLTYTYGEYQPLESVFKYDNAKGFIRTRLEIETLRYVHGGKEWLLFD